MTHNKPVSVSRDRDKKLKVLHFIVIRLADFALQHYNIQLISHNTALFNNSLIKRPQIRKIMGMIVTVMVRVEKRVHREE